MVFSGYSSPPSTRHVAVAGMLDSGRFSDMCLWEMAPNEVHAVAQMCGTLLKHVAEVLHNTTYRCVQNQRFQSWVSYLLRQLPHAHVSTRVPFCRTCATQ